MIYEDNPDILLCECRNSWRAIREELNACREERRPYVVVTDTMRKKRWMIYHDGNLVWSKIATILLICITCIGTRNKKHLENLVRLSLYYRRDRQENLPKRN